MKESRTVKKWLPPILVVILLVLLAFALRGRTDLPPTPRETISAFFDAAAEGDDTTYLRLTTGELRRSLESDRSQLGKKAFRENLVRSSRGIKGTAITEPDDAIGDVLDLEIVFVDRVERQRVRFTARGGGWAISYIERAEVRKPPIPYGTPVFEDPAPEEGPPGNSPPPDDSAATSEEPID